MNIEEILLGLAFFVLGLALMRAILKKEWYRAGVGLIYLIVTLMVIW